MEPKLYQREDGKWVVLDQPGTVFWWAMFEDEKTARHAFELFGPKPKGETGEG